MLNKQMYWCDHIIIMEALHMQGILFTMYLVLDWLRANYIYPSCEDSSTCQVRLTDGLEEKVNNVVLYYY